MVLHCINFSTILEGNATIMNPFIFTSYCKILLVLVVCSDISKCEPEKIGDVGSSVQYSYFAQVNSKLDILLKQSSSIQERISRLEATTSVQKAKAGCCSSPNLPSSCAEIQRGNKNRILKNGVFIIATTQKLKVEVYCDFVTDDGGWTVFQRRDDVATHIDFYREWNNYKWGFGDLTQEFWLGLEPLYHIMNDTAMTLRVDMDDFEGNSTFAQYNLFLLENEANNYKLNVAWYTGTAGDSLTAHSGMNFSTKDRDLDKHSNSCAVAYKGAWWYKDCHWSNLNGKYLGGEHTSFADGVNWKTFRGYNYSLKRTEMKIRPTDFSAKIEKNC